MVYDPEEEPAFIVKDGARYVVFFDCLVYDPEQAETAAQQEGVDRVGQLYEGQTTEAAGVVRRTARQAVSALQSTN